MSKVDEELEYFQCKQLFKILCCKYVDQIWVDYQYLLIWFGNLIKEWLQNFLIFYCPDSRDVKQGSATPGTRVTCGSRDGFSWHTKVI